MTTTQDTDEMVDQTRVLLLLRLWWEESVVFLACYPIRRHRSIFVAISVHMFLDLWTFPLGRVGHKASWPRAQTETFQRSYVSDLDRIVRRFPLRSPST